MRPIQLDAKDARPRSFFAEGTLTPGAIIAGVLAVVFVHLALPYIVWAIVHLLSVAGLAVDVERPLPEDLPPVIQARFLQLGEQIDPRQLPNRRVPILRTDRPQPMPSKRSPTEPPPERTERQANSVADVLQRLSNDAQIFAEAEERRVQEGDPDGIEGGDTEASEGDLYAGRLSSFFWRGWTVPTTLSRDQVQRLTTTVMVEIGDDLKIHSFRIARGSGDADFDLSVGAQIQRLIDTGATIPPPPEEVAAQYLGQTRPFRFNGRNAR
jgi:TonB C terminal